MPRGGKLPDEAVAHIAAWIDHGAPYDQSLLAGKTETLSWTQKTVSAEARRFWSFQPLRHVEPPAVSDQAWCRTPVDRFILARLEAAGLTPNPPVGSRQLIRRAYFDLIGLPPSPEEVDAFVNDTAPDAYEKLIDRLLAVAALRRALGTALARPGPLRREPRLRARLRPPDGLPLPRFRHPGPQRRPALRHLRELAAGRRRVRAGQPAGADGDRLPGGGRPQHPDHQNEVEKQRYDELDDMPVHDRHRLLGLTVGCARCHDHKFDPIPQARLLPAARHVHHHGAQRDRSQPRSGRLPACQGGVRRAACTLCGGRRKVRGRAAARAPGRLGKDLAGPAARVPLGCARVGKPQVPGRRDPYPSGGWLRAGRAGRTRSRILIPW